jgi:hypothetical protein
VDPFFEKFIADLVKGAAVSPFTGAKTRVEISHENRGREEKLASFGGTLMGAYNDGVKAAATAFGVKEANILSSLLGAAKPMGRFLTKNPIGQQITGTGASMAMQRMMTPQQQPQPMT